MITLLILAHNEENFIKTTVLKYVEDFEEIVIVEDASRDNTLSICNDLIDKYENIKLIRNNKNLGAGKSFELGVRHFLSTNSDYLIKIDGDDQFKYDDVINIVSILNSQNIDYIKCDRFWEKGIEGKIPFIRYVGNAFASILLKFSTGNWKLNDPLNGLFAISRKGLMEFELPRLFFRYGYPFYLSTYLSNISFEKHFVTGQIKNTISYSGQKSNLKALTMFFKLIYFTFSVFFKKIKMKIKLSSLQASAILDLLGLFSVSVSLYCLIRFLLIRYGNLIASQATWFLIFLIFLFLGVNFIFQSQKSEFKYKLKYFHDL